MSFLLNSLIFIIGAALIEKVFPLNEGNENYQIFKGSTSINRSETNYLKNETETDKAEEHGK